MDYLHVSLRTVFANNDKKLRALRRHHNAKFALYISGTNYHIYTYCLTGVDRFKNPWTT